MTSRTKRPRWSHDPGWRGRTLTTYDPGWQERERRSREPVEGDPPTFDDDEPGSLFDRAPE